MTKAPELGHVCLPPVAVNLEEISGPQEIRGGQIIRNAEHQVLCALFLSDRLIY